MGPRAGLYRLLLVRSSSSVQSSCRRHITCAVNIASLKEQNKFVIILMTYRFGPIQDAGSLDDNGRRIKYEGRNEASDVYLKGFNKNRRNVPG
jgi:hypothetical protein